MRVLISQGMLDGHDEAWSRISPVNPENSNMPKDDDGGLYSILFPVYARSELDAWGKVATKPAN